MEEFMTVILTELLEKEFRNDDEMFSSTFTQFWGKEKIVRKFLGQMMGSVDNVRCIPP